MTAAGELRIRILGGLAGIGAAVCLLAGCVGAGRVEPTNSYAQLEPEASVELGSSAAAICQDGEALLVLENSGTRVLRLMIDDLRLSNTGSGKEPTTSDSQSSISGGVKTRKIIDFRFLNTGMGVRAMIGEGQSAAAQQETIPLTDRVTAPAGIAADRFCIYIYDDRRLYRMSKEKLNLQPWLGDVRVAGLASFEPGIVLVSDADNNVIWYKGLFGESRMFLSSAQAARPGAMVALGDGSFAVLRPGSRLLFFFNRSGVVTRSVSLPAACDLLAANDEGLLCMGMRGRPQVWVLRAGKMTGYSLPDSVSPLSLAFVGGRLVVLDAGTRIRVYRIAE